MADAFTSVYRKPGRKPPYSERMVMRSGRAVSLYTWKWYSADYQSRSVEKKTTHATVEEAQTGFETERARIVEAGWKPVQKWPGAKAKPVKATGSTS